MLVARRLYASHTARVACRAMTVPHPLSLRTMAFITPIPTTKQPIAPLGARLPPPLATCTAPARRAASGVACRSYASPEVYDIAFSFRDFESEVAFLLEAQATHGTGPLSRFLEIGCGPARHCTLLASAANTTCIGLDASQEMIDYATQRAQREGVTDRVAFVQGDMAAPGGWAGEIPGGSVDMAAVLLGTLCHCLDNATALQCFRNLAEAVRPGGLLVLELAHPGELFGGSFVDPLDFVDCWEVSESGDVEFAEKRAADFDPESPPGGVNISDSSSDGSSEEEEEEDEDDDLADIDASNDVKERRVLVEYGREGDDFDPATQVLSRTVGLSLFDPEGEMVSSDVSVVPQRQFSLQEVDLLARATGWVVVAAGGDLAPGGIALDDEEAYRMVVVLKKT